MNCTKFHESSFSWFSVAEHILHKTSRSITSHSRSDFPSLPLCRACIPSLSSVHCHQDNEIARHVTELGQWERKMEREKNVAERYRRMLEESKTPLAMAQVKPLCIKGAPPPAGIVGTPPPLRAAL